MLERGNNFGGLYVDVKISEMVAFDTTPPDRRGPKRLGYTAVFTRLGPPYIVDLPLTQTPSAGEPLSRG